MTPDTLVDVASDKEAEVIAERGPKKRRLDYSQTKRVRFPEDTSSSFERVVTDVETTAEIQPPSKLSLVQRVPGEVDGSDSDADQDITSQLCKDCSESQQVAQLYETIEALQREIQELNGQRTSEPSPPPPPPPRIQIFHKVICECNTATVRFGQIRKTTYTDAPYRMTGDRRWHLQGYLNAPEEFVFLEQNKDVVLLIYRYYQCKTDAARFQRQGGLDKEASTNATDAEPPMPYQESMMINSNILREALNWASSESQSPGRPGNVDLHVEIFSPYHYLYHDRLYLGQKATTMDQEDQAQFNLLMEYVRASFETSYKDASAMFSKGLVSYDTIDYLFEPKMFVLAQEAGDMLAYETNCWLEDSRDLRNPSECWKLECWSWKFDGAFRKCLRSFEFQWLWSHREVRPIQSLAVYPLKYASENLESELHVRGQKFWSCRDRTYVSYEDEENLFGDPVQVSCRNSFLNGSWTYIG